MSDQENKKAEAEKTVSGAVDESVENIQAEKTVSGAVDESVENIQAEETVSADNGGKKKKEKKKLTKEQKKKRTIKALIITGAIVLVIAIFFSSCAIANAVGFKALVKAAQKQPKVEYSERTQFVKVDSIADATEGNLAKDKDGYWTFVTNSNLKVLQFTDVHIGAGCFSQDKDTWAMNAVATMIRQEQPDLVVITGDIAYPVPFQAGTFNNLNATKIFANLMESLGVYWTFAFGNHDTEVYGTHTRKDICKYYEGAKFNYCLFERGYASEELGYGNNIIKVKNTEGIVTHAIVTLDSHSYIDGDYFGAAWKYDNIHKSQVEWYCAEMDKLKAVNVENGGADEYVPNLAFFHIPLTEYRDAWGKIIEANGGKKAKKATEEEKKNIKYNSLNEADGVEYIYGIMGESDKEKNNQRTYGVFCGIKQDSFFEDGAAHGLQGTFCGHDHYNNFSVVYENEAGRVRLTYGMSIDYLAYPGIYKEHLQRGCTVIELTDKEHGEYGFNFTATPKNYYEYKNVKHEKD